MPATYRKVNGSWQEDRTLTVTPLPLASRPAVNARCAHLGADTGETVTCQSCRGNVQLKLYECAKHGKCTLGKWVKGVACCAGNLEDAAKGWQPCADYAPETPAASPPPVLPPEVRARLEKLNLPADVHVPEVSPKVGMRWACAVTTVPARRDTLLPRTLASLKAAGFDSPWLFVDGDDDARGWERMFGLRATTRYHGLRTHGNWVLTLLELWVRDGQTADRFAIFQDDLVTYRNLRQYLERCEYPANGYWNLYTFPQNYGAHVPAAGATGRKQVGWFRSNQMGRGAVGLVFDRRAVLTLLTSLHMAERPLDPGRGWRAVDGGIVTAFAKAGGIEYIHSPSLVQHTGDVSTMGNRPHPLADSFRGEDFDALTLVEEAASN